MKIPDMTPTDIIIQYRQQGYDDDSIIKALQQQNYDSQQIFDAFNQADLKSQAIGGPVQGMTQGFNNKDIQNTEQMIESIIEEKWKEFQQKLSSIDQWKEEFESTIMRLEEDVKHLKDNYDRLHQGVLGKISEYDSNLKDVGSSVKAMDKVFKQILPTLTDNVNKLSRMTNPGFRKPTQRTQ